MKKTDLVLIWLLCLNLGCVSNPYHEPQKMAEIEAQKYPKQANQIREQQKEWENQQRLKPAPSDSYVIEQEKLSGFAVGGPDAAFHLGSSHYQYIHKINLTLTCEKDSFLPKPYSQKNVKWKMTNLLSGEVQTSREGKLQIQIKNDSDQRFRKLTLSTSKKSYDVFLSEFPTIELEKEECY